MRHKYFSLLIIFVFICAFTTIAFSASQKPMTVSELALYKGADRQKILEEGARKEGKLMYYTVAVSQRTRPLLAAFLKKYPFLNVEEWRGQTNALVPKVMEEYNVHRYEVDCIELTQVGSIVFTEAGIAQEFYSPQMVHFDEAVISRGKAGGAYTVGNLESGQGLGFNTKLITRKEVPKTHKDLLDPKWKGKMVITGGNQGSNWLGTMLVTYGEEFVKQFAQQKIILQAVSVRTLVDLLAAGEYVLSPTITDAHVEEVRKKGGPVDWVPLEPVGITLGQVLLPAHASHPHAAMLFLDFALSLEAGKIYEAHGYRSIHKEIAPKEPYKKFYGAKSMKQVREWSEMFNRMFQR